MSGIYVFLGEVFWVRWLRKGKTEDGVCLSEFAGDSYAF